MKFYLWLAALVMIFYVAPLYWLASNHPEYWWRQPADVGPQPEPLPAVVFVMASAYNDQPEALAAELSRLVKLGYHLAPSSGIGGRWFVMWKPQGCVMEMRR